MKKIIKNIIEKQKDQNIVLTSEKYNPLKYSELKYLISGDDTECKLDQNILRRCVRNIFRNAKEANSTEIHVHVTKVENHILIQIQNNGTSMSADAQKRLFEPFYTTKAQGTGLGLAICKQELSLFGADLSLKKEPPTTFELRLPDTK